MATAKNKKAAATKKSSSKSTPKKAVKAKPAAKKPAPKAPAKKAVKSAPAKAVKKTTKPAPKKAAAVKPVKKAAPVTAGKKSAPAKTAKKVVAVKTIAKPEPKKSAKVVEPKKVANEEPKAQVGKTAKTAKQSPAKAEVKVAAVKATDKASAKSNPSPAAKPGKPVKAPKGKDDGEAPDPLHLKAEKVIKELEETMDLSKMRPRIQAGTTPTQKIVKHIPAPLKLVEPVNTTKVKYQLEFEFRSSPKILFASLSDSSGLAGWFADEVKTKDNVYTFIWEGGESPAKLVAIRDLQLVRFQWLDDIDDTYFQFEIKEDDITADIALVITDFANPGDKDTAIRLWESQVQKLRMLLGSL
jgi:uncharacterized protein YndB with AHSA1/START domain